MEKRESFFQRIIKGFNMLWFIMALGFGGTSIAGFAFLNYTIKRTPGVKGLIHIDLVEKLAPGMGNLYSIIASYLNWHIAIFGVMHLVSLAFVWILFFLWRNKYPEKYSKLSQDTTRNSVIISPALAVGMTFNVFLIGGYYYSSWVRTNMQSLMGFALVAWTFIWLYTLVMAIKIQSLSLARGFDVSKVHFGWLLVPFALGMTSVSGSGIAALAHGSTVANIAFFMSLIPFTMAIFLLSVKLFSLFKEHYQTGLSQKVEFLPSFFIVIPIITLLSITLFRYGHFLDHQLGGHLPKAYFTVVTTGGWAMMFWYIALGIVLLKDYWKNNLFNMKYFDESQWGLICPMVAFAVLGSFVYKTLLPNPIFIAIILTFMALDVSIILAILVRQYKALKYR